MIAFLNNNLNFTNMTTPDTTIPTSVTTITTNNYIGKEKSLT